MRIREIINVLSSILYEQRRTNNNLDMLIKRISVLHNEKSVGSAVGLYGWLTPSERSKAKELRKKDPEAFDYITECMKLFLTKDGDD